jgi:homoserine O-succinyltransferase/O-acetyltransferase
MMETRLETSADSSNGVSLGYPSLVVGLVNNMPDAALEATERQFRSLLLAASGEFSIYLRIFSIPEQSRSEVGREYVRQRCLTIDTLWTGRLDGLIVTGTEPRAQHFPDEPYWPSLTRLIEWAGANTISTIWSCLAAHAAVYHLDGIKRRPLGRKLFGVFECAKSSEHPIVRDAPSRWWVPHSRHNGLPEEDLLAGGYRVLSRSLEVGADIFVKQGDSLSVFVQGHPEYEPDTLLREYRRDVRRFVAGERGTYPEIPGGYFDRETEARFDELRDRIVRKQDDETLVTFPSTEGRLTFNWRQSAVRLYSNWLSYLLAQKYPGESLKKTSCAGTSQAA